MPRGLDQAKAARNAANEAFQEQLLQVQEDLEVRSIGGRIADRAGETLAEAGEVVSEHKGIVAGTIAALVLWVLRRPIISLLRRLWAGDDNEGNADDD